jgi:hypothetical protein
MNNKTDINVKNNKGVTPLQEAAVAPAKPVDSPTV